MPLSAAYLSAPDDGSRANLAMAASLAAIAFDRMARGENASLGEVSKLVEVLKAAIKPQELDETENDSSAPSLLDPVSVELLRRALASTSAPVAPPSIPELSKRIQMSIQRLQKAARITDNVELQSLREFCLVLSQSAQLEMPATLGGVRIPILE